MIIKQPSLTSKIKIKLLLPLLFLAIVAIFVAINFYFSLNTTVISDPQGHFFTESVQVQLKAKSSNQSVKVRYTLDGSIPNAKSKIYRHKLNLTQTTPLRFALFRKQRRISQVKTHNYFIDAQHQMPVVALTTDPVHLWDQDKGIYVKGHHDNYEQRGQEWQRPAILSFYTDQQQLNLQRPVGIRIHGGATRSFPQKSIRIYADHEEEGSLIHYDFFDNGGDQGRDQAQHDKASVDKFSSLILRSAGNDWEFAHMRDVLIQRIARKDTSLDTQRDLPVVVYLNGQYWGLYYLRERIDLEYFRQKYGANKQKISIFEVPHDQGSARGEVKLDEGNDKQGVTSYNKILEESRRCRGCVDYNHLAKFIDLKNFIDYSIFEFHFANFDWPYGNSKLWRYQNDFVYTNLHLDPTIPDIYDGRFRYLLYDLDLALGATSENQQEMVAAAQNGGYGRMIDDHFPFRNIYYDSTFQENYFNRYANLLNTSLSTHSVLQEIDQLQAEIEPEMPRHIQRWKDYAATDGRRLPQSMKQWRQQVDLLRTYVKHRNKLMRQNTLEQFEDSFIGDGLAKIQVKAIVQNDKPNINFGSIKIHDMIIDSHELPWEADYFTQVSINFEAQPAPGFRFLRWEGDLPQNQTKQKEIRLHIDQDLKLKAVFSN
jgi:hypothetical protein